MRRSQPDEFATRLGRALSEPDDAIFDWLSVGQPITQLLSPAAPPPG